MVVNAYAWTATLNQELHFVIIVIILVKLAPEQPVTNVKIVSQRKTELIQAPNAHAVTDLLKMHKSVKHVTLVANIVQRLILMDVHCVTLMIKE